MKIIKNKYSVVIITLVLLVATVSYIFINHSNIKDYENETASIKHDDKVVRYDQYLFGLYERGKINKEEQRVEGDLKCLYKIACENGFEISENEAKKITNEAKKGLKISGEEKKIFKYIKNIHLTKKGYWENRQRYFKMTGTIERYLEYSTNEYLKKKGISENSENYLHEYSKAYNQIAADCIKKCKEIEK